MSPILEVVRHGLGHWLVRYEGEDVGVVAVPGIVTTEAPYTPGDFAKTEFRFSVLLWEPPIPDSIVLGEN